MCIHDIFNFANPSRMPMKVLTNEIPGYRILFSWKRKNGGGEGEEGEEAGIKTGKKKRWLSINGRSSVWSQTILNQTCTPKSFSLSSPLCGVTRNSCPFKSISVDTSQSSFIGQSITREKYLHICGIISSRPKQRPPHKENNNPGNNAQEDQDFPLHLATAYKLYKT